MRFRDFLSRYVSLLVLILAGGVGSLSASPSSKIEGMIRDTEIEETLQMYLKPLAQVAGLRSASLQGYILASPSLNAFATLNSTIVIHSGLILEAPSLEAFLGVIAHELGHIQCGHLARRVEALQQAQYGMMTSLLVGLLAGVGTGRGDVGTSVAIAGSQWAQNRFLLFSQGEESAADQAAIDYLTTLKWPLDGLERFLMLLQSRQRGREDIAGVLTTHPPTPERIEHIRHAVQQQRQRHQTSMLSPLFQQRYQRMVAKLRGFLTAPAALLKATESASSFEGRYTRAIALFRAQRIQESMKLLTDLLAQEPENPFLCELKGQFLLSEGDVKNAVTAYRQAIQHHSGALLKIGYAQALLALEDDKVLPETQNLLEDAQKKERDIPFLWQGLSIVYGKQGKMALCQLALAEKALLMRETSHALKYAEKAQKLSQPHSREWLRAEDMIQSLKNAPKKP